MRPVASSRRLRPLAALALAAVCTAPVGARTPAPPPSDAPPPLELATIMADPDWIGNAVEQAWWSWDSRELLYTRKREGATVRDLWRVPEAGGEPRKVDDAARARLDAARPVFDHGRARMAFARNGDIFVRDLRGGGLTQLTRSEAQETRPQWSRDGALVWRADNAWFRWTAGAGVVQAANVQAADDPAKPPKADDLRDRQLRLIDTLKNDRDRRDAAREQERAWRLADPTRAPTPVYLGKTVEIADSALSPDGRWLLVATTEKDADAGQAGKMPKYLTESGYEEFEEVRTRVGRNAPLPHTLWLVDVAAGKASALAFDALPGIATDPLAALRKAAKRDPLKGARPVRIETDGDGNGPAIHWSADGRNAAVLVRAIDNKDRWIATVDVDAAVLRARHRLTDPAWINWNFNEFGWLPDGRTLWFVSEDSGYAHLYTTDAVAGGARALTSGRWEASAPQLSADGERLLFLCNRAWPGDYEVCDVPVRGGAVRELTALDGVEDFALSPDGTRLAVRHSDSYTPPQLAVLGAGGGDARTLTDTRSAAFKAMTWIAPRYVQVPSKHGAGTVWGKYYGPETPVAGKRYPIVLFVHGAGYLQNVHDKYPNYYREQMFHNLLVRRGYIVLDLDFRASEGYGRDWRTAIYQRMGTPELEDYLDGIDWLVANQQGDRDRVGVYGGSYGGFMTFMALFKQPGVFKAGAALRPVTDWSQYNHEYTSNILNTPELDPEAYKRSSPLEYADRLRDHLLIAHGMIDDNVFYKDSVTLAQRLIELRKHNWELASYPMERHAYAHPEAWYDQYRRIYELFERTLKAPTPAPADAPPPEAAMRCPTCRTRSLIAVEDLRGAGGGHCPACRGRWCPPDEAVALGVLAHADVRSGAVAIAPCPACARHSLAPVDAVRAVPVRPLHCARCERVWIAGDTLDAIRGAPSRAAAGNADAPHSLWARMKVTYGADADEDDDRTAQDIERRPLALAAAVPAAALLVWLMDASGLLRFALQSTLIMGFHEAGHAIAAWLTGRVAVPLPFLTLSTDASGPFGYSLAIAVLCAMLWVGVRRRLPFWIGVAALGAWLLVSHAFAGEALQRQWISAAGVGGEFALGTLCVVAFFHRAYRRPSWDLMRYAALLAGMAVLLPSWTRWRRIDAGEEPFPLGSLIFGDDDGDMNRLLAAGLSQRAIVDQYVSLGRLCIAVIVAYWLWTAWRAYTARARGDA